MQTPSFEKVNHIQNLDSLLGESVDDFAFKTLPKLAFETEFYFQEWQQLPINWKVLGAGYLIGKGLAPADAIRVIKKVFDYANKQSHDHWSRSKYSPPRPSSSDEAISLRGVGDPSESER